MSTSVIANLPSVSPNHALFGTITCKTTLLYIGSYFQSILKPSRISFPCSKSPAVDFAVAFKVRIEAASRICSHYDFVASFASAFI